MDLATTDHLLTTTRSVRKRLDFTRPVPRSIIEECIEIAFQAPSGSNSQGWSFVVVTDPAKRQAISNYYSEIFTGYANSPKPDYSADPKRAAQQLRVSESAQYLADHMAEAPVLVIPCLRGRPTGSGSQAGFWGSLLPAAWSFMLALRARGLGTAWTTLHLGKEREISELLGIPENVSQGVLFPVAYFTGDDFKVARRVDAKQLTHWDTWGEH
jgi:nitroreductase